MRYYLARVMRVVEDTLAKPQIKRRLAECRETEMLEGWWSL